MLRLFKKWKPSNEPTQYDEARVTRLKPIEVELKELGLPISRYRKLKAILNALEVQIEDGGDNPQVNAWLLEALRESVKHQVGRDRGKAALRAIRAFRLDEIDYWRRVKAGTSPVELSQEKQLDDLMQGGYDLVQAKQWADACDQWLEAWELIKQMSTPEMRTVWAFDDTYPGLTQFVSNWCTDLDAQLYNAGISDLTYCEHRLRYAREFLARFPDEDANRHVNFLGAQGEALWNLGQRTEAEKVYEELVEQFPDEAWSYIGWSDQYWLWGDPEPKEYGKAEAILKRALERPNLRNRSDVLERMESLHEEWGKDGSR